MKKILLIFICICVVLGCAHYRNTVPPGKTIEANWEADEKYCRDISGKITGFWGGFLGVTTLGLPNVLSGANDRYNKCLVELGWMEYR